MKMNKYISHLLDFFLKHSYTFFSTLDEMFHLKCLILNITLKVKENLKIISF